MVAWVGADAENEGLLCWDGEEAQEQMGFRARRLAGPMAEHVECVWVCSNAPGPWRLERVLPPGRAQLIVNLREDQTRSYRGERMEVGPGTVVSGIGTRYEIIDSAEQEEVAGVVFRPGGTLAFFGLPADLMSETGMAVEDLWGAGAVRRLRERLLESRDAGQRLAVLEEELRLAWTGRGLHPAVAYALRQFQATPSLVRVGGVAKASGLSQKRLGERFQREVGISPKRYCRLLRFQQAVGQAHGAARPDWSAVAADCGFSDQAHLIHEFQAFAGLTPGEYEARRTAFQNHVGN
jgi:AraC-like DNA-binding protein